MSTRTASGIVQQYLLITHCCVYRVEIERKVRAHRRSEQEVVRRFPWRFARKAAVVHIILAELLKEHVHL